MNKRTPCIFKICLSDKEIKLHGLKIKGVLNFNTVFCVSVNREEITNRWGSLSDYVMEKAKLPIVEELMVCSAGSILKK